MNLTGPMRLPEIYDLDIFGYPLSTARPERSAIFSIHNLQIIKNFGKRYSCYAGIQNIFNYIQSFSPLSGYNDPAFSSGFSPFFDTSYNYGTIQGREFFIGFRMNIEKKNT
jgi:outer membrane receptor for ferrienterochelin and colicins